MVVKWVVLFLSETVGNDWRVLLRRLNPGIFHEVEIEQIEQEDEPLREKVYSVIKIWRRTQREATFLLLMDALKAIERPDLAGELIYLFSRNRFTRFLSCDASDR